MSVFPVSIMYKYISDSEDPVYYWSVRGDEYLQDEEAYIIYGYR